MGDALQPLTFRPQLYKRLVPKQFLAQHLSHDPPVRPDGRALDEFRELAITTGSLSNTYGSAVVRNGNTIMVCGIRGEIMVPEPFTPNQGALVCNIEIGPLSHAGNKAGPPSDAQQSIAYQLQELLVGTVDLTDLCIEPSKAAWALYIDIVCLSASGSLLSTAHHAALAALSSTSLPKARWSLQIEPHAVRCTREYTPLTIHPSSYLFEFAIFGDCILADPDDEESLAEGVILVSLTQDGQIQRLRRTGSATDIKLIDQAITTAQNQVAKVHSAINSGKKHAL